MPAPRGGCLLAAILALVAGIAIAALATRVVPLLICRGDNQLVAIVIVFDVAAAVVYLILDLRWGGRVGPAILRTILVAIVLFLPLAVAIPGLLHSVDESRLRKSVKEMEGIGEAIDSYRVERGRYPTVAELGQTIPRRDPWRNPYRVEITPTSWTVTSMGVCGTPGQPTSYWYERDLILRDGVWISGREP